MENIMDYTIIGKNIENLRNSKNMKQEEFANIMGISRPTVSNWEQGKNPPTKDSLSTVRLEYPYEGSKTLTYTIRGIDISDKAATLEQTTYVFDGTAHKPAVTVEGLTEGTDYTVSYKNNTSYGTATVIITGAGNYEGTIQLTFTISAPAGIAEEDIEDLQSDLGLSAAGAVTILDFANKNDIAKETMLITDKSITTQKSEEVKAATFIVLSAKSSNFS